MVNEPEPLTFDARTLLRALQRVSVVTMDFRSIEAMLSHVLGEVLDIFSSDRAWLVHPCDLTAGTFTVAMERTKPQWPGGGQMGEALPIPDSMRMMLSTCLSSNGPIGLDLVRNPDVLDNEVMRFFGVKSMMLMALYPRGSEPWIMGVHHCVAPRSYEQAVGLFQAVGRQVADSLTNLFATRELRQSEARFRTLVENAPEAIVILDCEKGVFIDANEGAAQLFGAPLADVLESGGPADFSPEFQPDGRRSAELAIEYVGKALQGEFPIFEWIHQRADGTSVPCEVRLARLSHGTRPMVRGSITDISERKRQEEERHELEASLSQARRLQALGQLTGGIAHDFNNLLTVILGNLDLIVEAPTDPDLVGTRASSALSAAERASALTHRLLAFSRRQPLRPTSIDVNKLLKGMEDLLRRSIGEEIDIELVLGGGLWPAEADATQLENAILNLAINARDAMPGGGRLTIEAGNARLDHDYSTEHEEVEPGQYVQISVTDSGVGIPEDLLEKVFAPYFTTKEVGRGNGLGLSMVFGFVKQSGGHVKAYSEEKVGTTMKIYLPRATQEAPVAQKAKGQEEVRQGQGQCILVVEDSESVRALTEQMLTELGYRVLVAETGAEALRVLASAPEIDLLFTDVVLPGGMNGAELVHAARVEYPDLRVLYTSGYTENAIIHHGRLDPGVNLVEKPFTKKVLALRVAAALEDE